MIHAAYETRGGEDESTQVEHDLLKSAGFEIDLHIVQNKKIRDMNSVSAGLNTVWSRKYAAEIGQLIKAGGYDVVHIQNFFPILSPSIHYAAKKNGCRVVQALRNYRLNCVNGLHFRSGKICVDCRGRSPIRGVLHKCYRESYLASAAVAAMISAHRLLKTWERQVDVFVTPSQFSKDEYVRAGFDGSRITVKPNFIAPPAFQFPARQDSFVFVGRLSEEKGVGVILEAWDSNPDFPPLVFVGDGPLRPMLTEKAKTDPRFILLGHIPLIEAQKQLAAARAMIFSSNCFETFGRTIVESFSVGTPVICADIGATAELVNEGENGRLFEAGSARSLSDCVRKFLGDEGGYQALSTGARESYERFFTPEANLPYFERLYEVVS